MKHLKSLTLFICLLTLSACSSVPLGTLAKLSQLDPLSSDPEQIRIALVADRALRFDDNAAQLAFGYKTEDKNQTIHTLMPVKLSTQSSSTDGGLRQQPQNQHSQHQHSKYHRGQPQTDIELEANQRISLFYLNQTQADKMRQAQSAIRGLKQAGVEGEGYLSISVTMACFENPLSENGTSETQTSQPQTSQSQASQLQTLETLNADLYMQFEQQGDFLLLQSDLDLIEVAKQAGTYEQWQSCE